MIAARPAMLCLLLSVLGGCAAQTAVAPVPAPKEAPINSLALEQCIRENGPETCSDDVK